MNEKQAKTILEMFGHDFDVLASWLDVENARKLVLINPFYRPSKRDSVQAITQPSD